MRSIGHCPTVFNYNYLRRLMRDCKCRCNLIWNISVPDQVQIEEFSFSFWIGNFAFKLAFYHFTDKTTSAVFENGYGLLERIIQNFFGNQFKMAVQGRLLHSLVAQLPNIICPLSSDLLFPDERGGELLLHVGLELQFWGGAGPIHLPHQVWVALPLKHVYSHFLVGLLLEAAG